MGHSEDVTELETPRLLLREWRSEDREAFAVLNGHPEVMRYLGGVPLTRAASDALADRIAQHFEEHGFGLWAVEVKGESSMAGFIGLAFPHFLPEVMPTVEVGWRLAHEVWGRGLATEGASECLRYAFGPLALGEVCSIHLPDNIASRRVMEKLGMHFDRDARRPDNGETVRVFKITREEWAKRRNPA
jgi:RimJ/RimL family protein N-acetyltransferase